MAEIRDIRVRDVNIPPIPDWLISPPTALPPTHPVTFDVGVPIIDMPGCVESHKAGNSNKELHEDDPNGLVTHCDSNVPFYSPLDYEPEQIINTTPAPVPKYKTPEVKAPEVEVPEIPSTPAQTVNVEETVEEISEPPPPEIPWQEKYLPAPEAATTTAAIAVVATTSALLAKPLADLLLKVIKPAVKKVVTKIAQIRGKKPKVLSIMERREEQRDRNQAIRALKKALKPKGK
jgi:hypothetical protein